MVPRYLWLVMRKFFLIFFLIVVLGETACADEATLPYGADMGPDPTLVAPKSELLPTVNIAPAKGWSAEGKPVAAPGLQVNQYASGLDHPRWIYVLPNGDVLVAETNAPAKPEDSKGIKGFIMKGVMKKAGAGVESADRITLLRDADHNGVAETKTTFLQNLHSPFGMALIGNDFYVANTNAVVKYPYKTGDTEITVAGTKLADLPAGPINHHWTKNIIASKDGKKIYATSGSNSNVGENGMENEVNRAGILEIDVASGKTRLFASGLRNPNGMGWQPESGALWTAVNERDELGSDLVPDYMTSVKDGGFYGWPYSYYGQHVDERPEPLRPDLVEKAIKPDFALGAHTASLGLAFYEDDLFPAKYKNGVFIGQHGSWNREPPSGYKVVFIPFKNGRPSQNIPEDVLTGFLDEEGNAMGRPVGVAVDGQGALLVADDVGNVIWRIVPVSQP